MTGARVCAALVTHNRRELLVEGVEALLGQTHPVARVVIVDNASTDGTTEHLRERGLLDRPEVEYVRSDANLGGAGGFARAFELALAGECDWLWVLDDDAEPRPNALARLLASRWAADPGVVALAQKLVNPDGSVQVGARGHLGAQPVALSPEEHRDGAELDFCTFVGLLARAEPARRIAPPRADFFIWCDDYEWCIRLREHGVIRLVPESEIVHKNLGHGFQTRRGQLVNRLTGWSYGATPYAGFWRNIAGARNWVWIRKTYFGESALGAARTAAQFVVKALLYDERPFARIPWIVRATRDGRRGVFRNVTPQEWAERLAR